MTACTHGLCGLHLHGERVLLEVLDRDLHRGCCACTARTLEPNNDAHDRRALTLRFQLTPGARARRLRAFQLFINAPVLSPLGIVASAPVIASSQRDDNAIMRGAYHRRCRSTAAAADILFFINTRQLSKTTACDAHRVFSNTHRNKIIQYPT